MASKKKLKAQRTKLLAERYIDKAVLRSCADFAEMVEKYAALHVHPTDGDVEAFRKAYMYRQGDDTTIAEFVVEDSKRVGEMTGQRGYVLWEWQG